MKKRMNLKAVVLSFGLAAGMMLPASASAQGVFGDMLDNYYAEKEQPSQSGGMLLRGSERGTISDGGGITNYGLGEEAPLGSGIAIMLVAGMGYVALKKKEDKQ